MNEPAALPNSSAQNNHMLAATEQLCRLCMHDGGFDGIAVAIITSPTLRDLVFSSDETAAEIDAAQFTVGEGPCLDAFLHNEPVVVGDIRSQESAARWPLFTSAVGELDVRGVHAWPLQTGESLLGSLELHSRSVTDLDDRARATAQHYADSIAATVTVELDPLRDPATTIGINVFARGNVHIAAGMLSVSLGVSTADALARLRSAAFSRNVGLTGLALDVVERRIQAADFV